MVQYSNMIYQELVQGALTMKQFTYTIADANGIHARPAAILVKEAKKFNCSVKISANDNLGDLKRILSVMSLGATKGTLISITLEGDDEELAFCALKTCLENNL